MREQQINYPKLKNSLFYVKWTINETAKLFGWIMIFSYLFLQGYVRLQGWEGMVFLSTLILLIIIIGVVDYTDVKKEMKGE